MPRLMLCSVWRSMWYRSSSSSSNSTSRRRNSVRSFNQTDISSRLRQIHDLHDRRGESLPVGGFLFEFAAAEARQRVILGPTVVLTRSPFGFNPAFLFQLVQSRIQRSVADLKNLSRYLLQPLADRPPVHRFERDNFQ